MKTLILALLMTSLSTFAGELTMQEAIDASDYELSGNALSEAQQEEIAKALIGDVSQEQDAYVCHGNWTNMNYLINIMWFKSKKYSVTISQIKKVTVITMAITDDTFNPKKQTVINFTTTADLKKVSAFTLRVGELIEVDKNEGTLLTPVLKKGNALVRTVKSECTWTQPN